MRKICEIDAVDIYAQTGTMPLMNNWNSGNRGRYQVNPEWFRTHFNTAQQKILEKHRYVLRPHPKHSPTIELFIDESNITESEWTLIRILF